MIQRLDMMTLVVMCLLINIALSSMLLMVGRHIPQARGIREWSLGILLIGLAMTIATELIRQQSDRWLLLPINMLFAYGNGLVLMAIRDFRGKPASHLLPLSLAGMSLAINILFLFVFTNPSLRLLFASLLYAGINAACARELLYRPEEKLRSAYLLTGGVFTVFAAAMLLRAGTAWLAPERVLLLPHPQMIAPGVFVFIGLAQLCATLGYVLLLTYRMASEMERLASHDSLTGALNRRSLDAMAGTILAQVARNGGSMTALLMDIDLFKAVNDCYGHQAGDETLRRFAAIARAEIRAGDFFARYGGEEFCVLMPNAAEADGCRVAERLRAAFASAPLGDGQSFHCTVSIGVADSHLCGLDFENLVKAADAALYCAKQAGRNCVRSASAAVMSPAPATASADL